MDRTAITSIDPELDYIENRVSHYNPSAVLHHINERLSQRLNQQITIPITQTPTEEQSKRYDEYTEQLIPQTITRTVISANAETQEYFDQLQETGPSEDAQLFNEIFTYLNRCNDQDLSETERLELDHEIMLNIATYFNRLRANPNHSTDQPSIQIAQLRRTALFLYKIARIPGVYEKSGSYKHVSMPYGLRQTNDPELNEFESEINFGDLKIANWDGRIPQKNAGVSKRAHRQMVRVSAKPKGRAEIHYGTPVFIKPANRKTTSDDEPDTAYELVPEAADTVIPKRSKSTEHKRDAVISKMIRGLLPKELKHHIIEYAKNTYVPSLNILGANENYWAEYIPNPLWENEYPFDPNQNPSRVLQIARLVRELNRQGYYLTDIKYENFRSRQDGTPVLVDVGEIYHSQTGYKMNSSFAKAGLVSSGEAFGPIKHEVSLEKVEVFQLGVLLLRSIFIDQNRVISGTTLNRTIDPDGTTYTIGDRITFNRQMVLDVFDPQSIAGRELAGVSKLYNERKDITDPEASYYNQSDFRQLILDCVNKNPEDRPTIAEFTTRLEAIMQSRAK